MAAKILYMQKGGDPAVIKWPASGPPSEQFMLIAGQTNVIPGLIGYGDGSITFPDGRPLPPLSSQGSTFVHLNN